MELILTNSSAIPTHVSVPSVLLQIFAGLQTLQWNTSQPQVLVQILPQPHSQFIQSLRQTDRGKQLVEENKVLRLRAQELLDSVVHIQNVVEEFKEQTQAASKQTSSIIERLRRNQKLVNMILEQHSDQNGSSLDFSQRGCSERLAQKTERNLGDHDLEHVIIIENLITDDQLSNTNSKKVSEEKECFPSGTKEKMNSFVKDLRDLHLQANEAKMHLRIVQSSVLANKTWLHRGLENCLYFQEESKQKDHLIKELRENIKHLQRAGGENIHLQKGEDYSDELEELKEQLKRLQHVADKREELLQETKSQISFINNELKVAKEQLQQYQNLAQERGVQLSETKEQLHHYQQLAEVRQLMLLEAKDNLAELQNEMKENSTTTHYQDSEKQVQKLVDGRQQHHQESSGIVSVDSKNQTAAGSIMNSRKIKEEEKFKARLHAILGGRSKEAALMDAAERGDVEHIAFLLDFGADVDAQDTTKKQTSLMRAAESGHLEAARLLIQRGASLEARATGWYNLTPLLYAAANKHLDIVKLLVEAGADITAVDSLGKTASVLGGKDIQDWLEGRTS